MVKSKAEVWDNMHGKQSADVELWLDTQWEKEWDFNFTSASVAMMKPASAIEIILYWIQTD